MMRPHRNWRQQRLPWLPRQLMGWAFNSPEAVVWLCQKVKKPILKLTNNDYMEHGMADDYELWLCLSKWTLKSSTNFHTITGWPGGKPTADDSQMAGTMQNHSKACHYFSVRTRWWCNSLWVEHSSASGIKVMKFTWPTKHRATLPCLTMMLCDLLTSCAFHQLVGAEQRRRWEVSQRR